MEVVLVTFLIAVTKCLTRSSVMEEGLIRPTFEGIQCIVEGKAWQHEQQLSGHITFVLRKPKSAQEVRPDHKT